MGWRFPLRFGARKKDQDAIHAGMLNYLSTWFDVDSDTELYAETRVDALAVSWIWSCNRRAVNQAKPRSMLESLPEWEEICTLRPAVGDTDVERRARVASKLRGQHGNNMQDLASAAEEELGVYYVTYAIVDPDSEVTYWPGLNPGPPGYEFSSNRATLGIQMSRDDLDDDAFLRRRAHLIKTLDEQRPAWLTFVVGVSGGFLAGVGVVGQTVLA